MTFDDATQAQVDAARPDVSTWLGANAGSGKTRVLTDRVARLLLSGVEPQHILCLTYTKAAASEMQNRLFKRLGAWAMLPDPELRQAMADLGIEETLDDQALRRARRLFALAIETPGGLKIQTIHSCCASILRRFPLEARVNPQFSEIEDRAADLLRADIVDDMASSLDAPLVAEVARHFTGEDLGALTQKLVSMRDHFAQQTSLDEVLTLFGQSPDLSVRSIEASVFEGDEAALFERIIPHLVEKGGNDAKAGKALADIDAFNFEVLPKLERLFLTGEKAKEPFSAKVGSFPTKPTQTVIATDMPKLNDLMIRVESARSARLALATAERTLHLHRFAHRFVELYEHQKQARGWLDFDDLIIRARDLLSDPQVAAWVLYRIDGGIDHILVDEAQDTSPRQWEIIERLTDEFTSGAGARNAQRTLFVVGDKKQSIYSFQGADPLEFDRKAELFANKITDSGNVFQWRSLDYSFRSASAILRLVDTVFDPQRRPQFDGGGEHIAFKEALPGRVDLWPVVEKAEVEEDRDWTDPIDRRGERHHTVVLAEQIADEIHRLTHQEHYIPDDGPDGLIIRRRIQPGDFLILVQRRSALFAELIRACKAKNLEIAGADRLKVGGELAVKDIAALLSFLSTPDDGLSLATALRSPLFGWTEQQLFHLAHRREKRDLWADLRDRDAEYPETVAMLKDLRSQTDFLRPYDLIERILTRHDGRRKLLGRLGPEAEDGINAMLVQALAYERNTVPSLTGFIEWMKTDDIEIKRQIDSASNQIRIMTVHGSKGLEAPIVILPDTGKRDVTIKDDVIDVSGTAVWRPSYVDTPQPVRTVMETMKVAEQAERFRLLYVAMTRAEKWLIVAAAGDLAKDNSSWYQITAEAMAHVNATQVPGTEILRFEEGAWDDLSISGETPALPIAPKLEPVFTQTTPIFAHKEIVLSPSDLGGAKALAGDLGQSEADALAFGTMVHRLMEVLPKSPQDARENEAQHLLDGSDPVVVSAALAEVERCLASPQCSFLFSGDAMTEVPATGRVGGMRLHGVIDLLHVTENRVLIVDYKTNRHVPKSPAECPEGILRQMGAYAAILAQIYPGRNVETAIIWTASGDLMYLPHDLVTGALDRSPYLDAASLRS